MLGDVAFTQGSRLIPLIRVGMFSGVALFFVATAIVLVAGRRKKAAAPAPADSASDDGLAIGRKQVPY